MFAAFLAMFPVVLNAALAQEDISEPRRNDALFKRLLYGTDGAPSIPFGVRNGRDKRGLLKNRCNCVQKELGSIKKPTINLKAVVIRSKANREFTNDGITPQFRIRYYVVKVTSVEKGSKFSVGSLLQAQGYDHTDTCGAQLQTGGEYVFNLNSSEDISPGSVWRKGMYIISICNTEVIDGGRNL